MEELPVPLSYSAEALLAVLEHDVHGEGPAGSWLRAMAAREPEVVASAAPSGGVVALLDAVPAGGPSLSRSAVAREASGHAGVRGEAVARPADVAAVLVAMVRRPEEPSTGVGTKTFRLFVSSTFDDFTVERDLLRRHVWPHLRQLCARRGARFQPIDLRWGVSEEAAVDQQTMNICLGEIERCQRVTPRPDFLVLLGDRYGWRPPPPQVPESEYVALHGWLAENPDAVLPWDDSVPVPSADDLPPSELLDRWYESDGNAVPAERRLRPRTGAYLDRTRWSGVESRLARALRAAATRGPDLPATSRRRYVDSATAQEIAAGALDAADPEQAVCFVRQIDGLPRDAGAWPYVDLTEGRYDDEAATALSALVAAVSERLGEPRVITAEPVAWAAAGPVLGEDYRQTFCTRVRDVLERSILAELDRGTTEPGVGSADPLRHEVAAHRAFAETRREFFTGRTEELARIGRYLLDTGSLPLVVHGEGGTGKSALMAQAVREAEERATATLLFRFVGATPGSSDGRSLLADLCQELASASGEDPEQVATDYADLVKELQVRLAAAARRAPVWLFVDSLDQLAGTAGGGARSLTWVPQTLPEGVRLVLSTRPGDTLDPLRTRAELLPLSGLPTTHGKSLLEQWLASVGRTLQTAQRDAVLAAFERSKGNPLYLRLAFQEASRWVAGDGLPPEELAVGVRGLIEHNLLARLASEDNHGRLLVARALGYLAVSRHGLAEDELTDLLSRDLDLYRAFLLDAYHLPGDLVDAAAGSALRPQDVEPQRWLQYVREAGRIVTEEPWEIFGVLASGAAPRSAEELAALTGVSTARAVRVLSRMAADGVVVSDDLGRWAPATTVTPSEDPGADPSLTWARAYRSANGGSRWAFPSPEPRLPEAAPHDSAAEDEAAVSWLRALAGWRDELDAFLSAVVPARVPGSPGGDALVARPRPGPELPVVLWSRLSFDLAPYLTERRTDAVDLLGFYHRELQDVAADVYADGVDGRTLHGRLADYFGAEADPTGDRSWAGADGVSVRGLAELPFHLTGAERWDDVSETLTDFTFLEQKALHVGVTTRTTEAGEESTLYTGVFALQDDYESALRAMPGGSEEGTTRPRLIVTVVDLGQGPQVRCPHCNTVHPVGRPCEACGVTHRMDDWVGREMACPRSSCGGPLRVNTFVVPGAKVT